VYGVAPAPGSGPFWVKERFSARGISVTLSNFEKPGTEGGVVAGLPPAGERRQTERRRDGKMARRRERESSNLDGSYHTHTSHNRTPHGTHLSPHRPFSARAHARTHAHTHTRTHTQPLSLPLPISHLFLYSTPSGAPIAHHSGLAYSTLGHTRSLASGPEIRWPAADTAPT
jgi:hypothetical protein